MLDLDILVIFGALHKYVYMYIHTGVHGFIYVPSYINVVYT